MYVELPRENGGDGTKVGLLRKSLYGIRDAALNWAEAYTEVLVDKLKFQKGAGSPCSFSNPSRDLKLVVRGGDLVVEGPLNNCTS